jgi:hypothetical protein
VVPLGTVTGQEPLPVMQPVSKMSTELAHTFTRDAESVQT